MEKVAQQRDGLNKDFAAAHPPPSKDPTATRQRRQRRQGWLAPQQLLGLLLEPDVFPPRGQNKDAERGGGSGASACSWG